VDPASGVRLDGDRSFGDGRRGAPELVGRDGGGGGAPQGRSQRSEFELDPAESERE
jgi:hypothetical protein